MNTPLNKEELLKILELPIKKLAALLYDSNMPDDIKEAWIRVLPKMSLEQIDRLINILEAKYADEQTGHIDEEYKKKIEALLERYDKEDKEREQKLIEYLKQLGL